MSRVLRDALRRQFPIHNGALITDRDAAKSSQSGTGLTYAAARFRDKSERGNRYLPRFSALSGSTRAVHGGITVLET
jgi:hypothetical protein